jgi:hypothetical protein
MPRLVVARTDEQRKAVSGDTDDVSAGQGVVVGTVWGGLVGLAALLIPGVGPFIALGALGAALMGGHRVFVGPANVLLYTQGARQVPIAALYDGLRRTPRRQASYVLHF